MPPWLARSSDWRSAMLTSPACVGPPSIIGPWQAGCAVVTGRRARRKRSAQPAGDAIAGFARSGPAGGAGSVAHRFERDRDRIIHSKAFRRLKHKTQVFIDPDGDHYVTRLTHTLQVPRSPVRWPPPGAQRDRWRRRSRWATTSGTRPSGTPARRRCRPYFPPDGWHHAAQSVRIFEVLEDLNLSWEVRDGIRAHSWKIEPPPAHAGGDVRPLRGPHRLPDPRRAGRHAGRRPVARADCRPHARTVRGAGPRHGSAR